MAKLTGYYRVKKDYDGVDSMCVYCIENMTNGKKYVGITTGSMLYRVNNHFKLLRNNKHYNAHLQGAYNMNGEESFRIFLLDKNIQSIDALNELELFYCNLYSSCDREFGYNLDTPGNVRKTSIETRKKQSDLWTPEKKLERSLSYKARHKENPIAPPVVSESGRMAISRKAKEKFANGTHHFIGRKQTVAQIQKGAATRVENGSTKGSNNPAAQALIVYNSVNQKQYLFSTVKEAAKNLDLNVCTLQRILNGRPTKTGLQLKRI